MTIKIEKIIEEMGLETVQKWRAQARSQYRQVDNPDLTKREYCDMYIRFQYEGKKYGEIRGNRHFFNMPEDNDGR